MTTANSEGTLPICWMMKVTKVLGRYTYPLSDGQKWNLRLLKHFVPPATTWSEILGAPPSVCENILEPANDRAIRDTVGIEELLKRTDQTDIAQELSRYPEREWDP